MAAALAPGEDAALELERARLASVDHLQGAARAAEELLYGGDDSARDRVAAAAARGRARGPDRSRPSSRSRASSARSRR